MTQASPTTADADLAGPVTAWQNFVTAFAASNLGQQAVIKAQGDVIAAQQELSDATHNSSDLKANLSRAYGVLEAALSGLGITLPDPTSGTGSAGTSGGDTAGSGGDATAPTTVNDPVTGTQVPVDGDTGAVLPPTNVPVPPAADDTAGGEEEDTTTGTTSTTGTTDGTGTVLGGGGADPNAGGGAGGGTAEEGTEEASA